MKEDKIIGYKQISIDEADSKVVNRLNRLGEKLFCVIQNKGIRQDNSVPNIDINFTETYYFTDRHVIYTKKDSALGYYNMTFNNYLIDHYYIFNRELRLCWNEFTTIINFDRDEDVEELIADASVFWWKKVKGKNGNQNQEN